MEIKPTGPGANLPPASDTDQPVNKAFSRQAGTSNVPDTASSLPLSSVLGEYRKADLQDPIKVEKMLSQCAGSLLNDALGNSKAALSANESSYLAGRLQNDPSVRGRLLNYLERVLK